MSRCSTIAFSIFVVCGLFISPRTTLAAEPEACPIKWLQGQFRYTDSTGESSTVVFEKIGTNSIRGSWTLDSGGTGTEVAGWHAASGKVVITGFGSRGDYWKIEAAEVDKTELSGEAVFGNSDGTENRGTFKFTWKSDDLAVTRFDGKDLEGNDVTFDGRFERIDRTSTRAEFQEFGELLAGRWAGDITLIADWPGEQKKQGDKIVGYSTYSWIADGQALQWDRVSGTTVGTTLFAYNALSKQIVSFNVGSGGGTCQSVIWKKSDNEWGWKLTSGSLVDGRKMGGVGAWVFTGGGTTHVIQGSVQLDGDELPKLHDVYSRLGKAGIIQGKPPAAKGKN